MCLTKSSQYLVTVQTTMSFLTSNVEFQLIHLLTNILLVTGFKILATLEAVYIVISSFAFHMTNVDHFLNILTDHLYEFV